jgi:hypothetical protein
VSRGGAVVVDGDVPRVTTRRGAPSRCPASAGDPSCIGDTADELRGADPLLEAPADERLALELCTGLEAGCNSYGNPGSMKRVSVP